MGQIEEIEALVSMMQRTGALVVAGAVTAEELAWYSEQMRIGQEATEQRRDALKAAEQANLVVQRVLREMVEKTAALEARTSVGAS